MNEVIACGAVIGRMCRGPAAGTFHCGAPATVFFVNEAKKKRLGRCADHAGFVDLSIPENQGWRREA